MNKVALVTGATQGLGLALAVALATRLNRGDVVYLTGRDESRVDAALGSIGPARATIRGTPLDVSDGYRVGRLADTIRAEHGGIDYVFSNAYHRFLPGQDPVANVEVFADVNNLGTTRMLRAFGPILRPKGRLIVVASTMGTLRSLAPNLHPRFDNLPTLDAVDDAVRAWRDAVIDRSSVPQGWPEFINIPSKIAQVAAVRTYARTHRDIDLRRGALVAAICPGMLDTPTSRPWFDMTGAATPEAAAEQVLEMLLDPKIDLAAYYGELVRFGTVLPWAA